jgi:hypothetical protein
MRCADYKVLACNILSAMDNQGFDLVGSVDMSMGTGENQTDCKFRLVSNLTSSGHLVLRKQGMTLDRGKDRQSMYMFEELELDVLLLSLTELTLVSFQTLRDLVFEGKFVCLRTVGQISV